MTILRKRYILALAITLLVASLYHRSYKEQMPQGTESGIKKVKVDTKGYDGSNPLKILTTQLITRHFNIHTNLDFERLDYFEKFFEGFFDYYDREFLKIKQPKPLEVFLFDGPKTYVPFARRAAGPDYSPYGFYSPALDIIVVNADTGLGVLTHELAHHFTDCAFDYDPAGWIHEAISTYFEKFIGHLDEDGKLHITFGYFSNWRLPQAKEIIHKFTFSELIGRSGFPQSLIRAFVMFLHEKGKFTEFVQAAAAESLDDPFGLGAIEKVYNKPLDEIEAEWKQWVLALPMDDEIFLVNEEFVKTPAEWDKWWSQNQHRLYFDPERQLYRVKDEYKNPPAPK
ncbi:MAG: hypothetical protein DRP65_08005 [Planctomycetota bacterium]|nr:MAG: hypothetical protein DRP65_08005 [Planctomycetota bacterium]